MNLPTFIAAICVIALLYFPARYLIRTHGCGCTGCAGCSECGRCGRCPGGAADKAKL